MKLKMSLVFLFCLVFVSSFTFGAIPSAERQALIDLYNATNGDLWFNNSGWKSLPHAGDGFALPGTEGTWKGVSVSNNHVVMINLKNNNLTGFLPDSIGTFPNLVFLYLDQNNISGEIPDTWLPSLVMREIYLGRNQLTGEIPPSLRNLLYLRVLDVSNNQIRGTVPSELSCTPLQVVNLEHNLLTGEIPCCISCMQTLTILDLSSNFLSGPIPEQLGNLHNLIELYLDRNQLTGSIPSSFGNLSKLKVLFLDRNELTGSLPASLGNLVLLEYFTANDNRLSGSIPSSYSNLINLKTNGYYLFGNMLTGDVYPSIVPVGTNYDYNALNPLKVGDENKQTTAPASVVVSRPGSGSTATISWAPIAYQQGNGGYEVFYRASGNPTAVQFNGRTPNKATSSMVVTGLTPGVTYYFKVRTVTDAYWANKNQVISEFSAEVVAF